MSLTRLKWYLLITLITAVFTILYFGNIANDIVSRTKVTMFKPNSKSSTKHVQIATINLQSIMNLPEWYRNEDWGLRENAALRNLTVEDRGLDAEDSTAWNNFFFGTTKGLVLEIGAMEGKDFSVSNFFESEATWRSILVEGNSNYARSLSVNRPNAINFNMVICDQPSEVHFADLNDMSGIIEFMSQGFLKAFYGTLLGENGQISWKEVEKAKYIKKLQCVPLTHVLAPLKIKHINFLVLDVEGAELSILKGIDFEQVTFDVIAVETDRGCDTLKNLNKNVNAVVEFLASKGYLLSYRKLGRNSWFLSPNFQPLTQH